ncbi:MAG: hypothetical protein KC561_12565, partial [Myxococcales bacterium]|nr:hypothetical protein [Myxococcales bacterium]
PNQRIFPLDEPVDPQDTTWQSISSCVPDFGSYDECSAVACPAGEQCVPEFNSDATALELRCEDTVGTLLGGASCTLDSQCRSGSCLANDTCLGTCHLGQGCAAGSSCSQVNLTFALSDDYSVSQVLDLCFPD